jgi:hypothetical protein
MAGNEKGKGTKGKGGAKDKGDEAVVDLAGRIGSRAPAEPVAPEPRTPPPPPPALPQQLDAPLPQRLDGPLPSRRTTERPSLIGADEATSRAAASASASEIKPEPSASDAIASPRSAPGPGEMDVVVTPLPTPDDWHRFELALRRVRGVSQLRPEYYRHGVAKMRVHWEGKDRLAQALRSGIPGYRVRVIGEDRGTIQILVSSDNEDRRPG